MTSGLANKKKAAVRQLYGQGKVGREELLESEAQSYHAPGTCTFYGTANSNQMLMQVMGLYLLGAAFINPNTPLRDALTAAAAAGRRSSCAAGGGAGARLGCRYLDPVNPGARHEISHAASPDPA